MAKKKPSRKHPDPPWLKEAKNTGESTRPRKPQGGPPKKKPPKKK